jgi:hypothetical protein
MGAGFSGRLRNRNSHGLAVDCLGHCSAAPALLDLVDRAGPEPAARRPRCRRERMELLRKGWRITMSARIGSTQNSPENRRSSRACSPRCNDTWPGSASSTDLLLVQPASRRAASAGPLALDAPVRPKPVMPEANCRWAIPLHSVPEGCPDPPAGSRPSLKFASWTCRPVRLPDYMGRPTSLTPFSRQAPAARLLHRPRCDMEAARDDWRLKKCRVFGKACRSKKHGSLTCPAT